MLKVRRSRPFAMSTGYRRSATREAAHFDEITPTLFTDLRTVQQQLDEMNPGVTEKRNVYSEVLEKRSRFKAPWVSLRL